MNIIESIGKIKADSDGQSGVEVSISDVYLGCPSIMRYDPKILSVRGEDQDEAVAILKDLLECATIVIVSRDKKKQFWLKWHPKEKIWMDAVIDWRKVKPGVQILSFNKLKKIDFS